MLEKLQLAEEETYKDPANIQSKHQKHQAFEAELGANADRIQSVLAMGQNLVRSSLFIVLFFFSSFFQLWLERRRPVNCQLILYNQIDDDIFIT